MKKKKISHREVKGNFCEVDALIFRFDQYMNCVRGLSTKTRKLYCSYARVFLIRNSKLKKIRINIIQSKDVIKFILAYTRDGGPKRAQLMVYSLRSFFRFLQLTQGLKENLVNCVPCVPVWKHSTVPVSLSTEELQKLLDSCNKNLPIGLRDFTIIMLLVQLGLRASEVCKLTLDDIDWDNGEIIIRGKGSTITRLPISQELGNALVAYLQHSRPSCLNRSFFICANEPLRGFQSSSTVRTILRAALMRAGLNPEKKGTHLLRHSFATQLLQQGATLQEIGAILRHKSISTTAIYARVDFNQLKTIVIPWPHNLEKGGAL